LQTFPSGEQFSVMNLRPCFHEPPLPLREVASDELNRIDRKDANPILVVRMKVRAMVGRRRLGEHTDDDPEESGDLWHPASASSPSHRPLR
jgi:hypothetical protein